MRKTQISNSCKKAVEPYLKACKMFMVNNSVDYFVIGNV